jgi:trehalose synthase
MTTAEARRAAWRLTRVASPRVSFEPYQAFLSASLRAQIEDLTHAARGLRVVHISSTAAGGGVAELLHSLVPLSRAAGVDAHWYVLPPDLSFFNVTKKLHNWLQGGAGVLGRRRMATYISYLERVAETMADLRADVWVVHDPQPMPLRTFVPLNGAAIWRCHIDCATPNGHVTERLLPYLRDYDRFVFSLPSFRLPGLDPARTTIEAPAIDPLSIKNRPLPGQTAQRALARLGIDPARPLVTQISRFDRWKGHRQAVQAYRIARSKLPDLQLALVGTFLAADDPEAPKVYRTIRDLVSADPDAHLFTDPTQVGAAEINAFQGASTVILQRSRREGFGLTVTEAMWKKRPVIARPVGGITTQIEHGRSGFLVGGARECAELIESLVRDRAFARHIGSEARRTVQRRFLLPRLLRDELQLYLEASGARRVAETPISRERRRSLTRARGS